MKVQVRLPQSIRDSAKHNQDVQKAPACILRPDHSRQWEAVIPACKRSYRSLSYSATAAQKIAMALPSGDIKDFKAFKKEKPDTIEMICP